MGRGRRLSEYEKGQIDGYHSSGLSATQIGVIIKRSQNVVSNYLRTKENYGLKKSTGRPSATTAREKRLLLRDLTHNQMSIMESKLKNGFKASKQTLWKVCQSSENIKYMKMKRRPKLSVQHMIARLEWARNHMSFGTQWQNVIFTDKQKV